MQLTTCCGCYSLRTGTTIIGIIHAILAVCTMVYYSIDVMKINRLQPESYKQLVGQYMLKAIAIGLVAFAIMALTLAILLIIGSKKQIKQYIFPYMCIGFGQIIFGCAYIIGYLSFLTNVPVIGGTYILIYVIGFIIAMALHTYLWLVIYSFYQELNRERLNFKANNLINKDYNISRAQYNV